MPLASGLLFSDYFLRSGIDDLAEWQALTPDRIERTRAQIAAVVDRLEATRDPNESVTERGAVEPILTALGWPGWLTQQTLSPQGRTDVPDYLLLADAAAEARARARPRDHERYRDAATFLEAKTWGAPLDRASGTAAPSTQMLRYLSLAEVQSNSRIRFAILTNGRHWRLYDQRARSRSEEFLEIDLKAIVRPDLADGPPEDGDRALRIFLLFFGRDAFVPDALGQTLHARALGESRRYEERVTQALADTVFGRTFADLAAAIRANDPAAADDRAYLDELREATLIYLYRLLFTLFAEDRKLLPTWSRDDGLSAMRDAVAGAIDARKLLPERRSNFDGDLRALWSQIDGGDPGIGLPPYNGRLFKESWPILARARIPDAAFAPILDGLSRTSLALAQKRISYRDLSVQHLGSIYERLLEFQLDLVEGEVRKAPNPFARKTSGSYYTPEELVLLVIRRTLTPLLEERRAAFLAHPGAETDPATRFLDLTVCDPAMGSGHFLVSLVDWLADKVLEAVADAEAHVPGHVSPLTARLAAIKTRIQAEARKGGWTLPIDGLEPRSLVRRIILKRVIHGVDKNPMAVELAKLSLWLHTFTVGAPLSFLDHHLRCGDSLFGEWVRDAQDFLGQRRAMLAGALVQSAKQSAVAMGRIEDASDADITEVHASAATFETVEEATAPLNALLSFVHAARWLPKADQPHVNALLDGSQGDLEAIARGEAEPRLPDTRRVAARLRALARDERFLHWQVAFPNRWDDWTSKQPTGGFDAVIGNPPWDRMKLQEVEWFAARVPAIALAQRASDRKAAIRRLREAGDPVADDYAAAAWHAEAAASVTAGKMVRGARVSPYPLLGGGDVNLYSLFVERAAALIKPDGIVGLLCPSGIAGDLGAAPFFRSISISGRLSAVFDFENRAKKPDGFFPEVDSRFKFCALVFGGAERRFTEARLGFFLPATSDEAIDTHGFTLGAADFARVNPNTGTTPVFRTRRDADLTLGIYARVPVLVNNSVDPPVRSWPVKYLRMFDMTNDSDKFRTKAELEAEGYYKVAGNRLKRGRLTYLPLYEGKMVQAFDHRAASVEVKASNLHRPAQPVETTPMEYADSEWSPTSQFWVSCRSLVWANKRRARKSWHLVFKEITAPTNRRTVIACIAPAAGFGNKLPLILSPDVSAPDAACFASLLNSFALDFATRQKVQGQTLNLYLVEQLPVLPPAAYDRAFGPKTAAEIVRADVLALTYTAHDMAPFARDMSYDGPPFPWNEDDRRRRRARLDALHFHLYGLTRDDAEHILSTFPIVEREDRALHGRYLTRDLILAWMAALAAGDPDADVRV